MGWVASVMHSFPFWYKPTSLGFTLIMADGLAQMCCLYVGYSHYNKKILLQQKKNCCNNIEVIAIVYVKCCNKI